MGRQTRPECPKASGDALAAARMDGEAVTNCDSPNGRFQQCHRGSFIAAVMAQHLRAAARIGTSGPDECPKRNRPGCEPAKAGGGESPVVGAVDDAAAALESRLLLIDAAVGIATGMKRPPDGLAEECDLTAL